MFSIHTTRGSLAIIVVDILLCYLFFSLFLVLIPSPYNLFFIFDVYCLIVFTFFTLVIVFSLAITNLYSFFELIIPTELFKRIVLAFLISCGYIVTLSFFIRYLALINWRLLPPLAATYVSLFFFRYLVLYGIEKNRKKVLIIGSNDLTREIIAETMKRSFRGYSISGVITSLESQLSTSIQNVPVLGLIGELEEIAVSRPIDIIVVTLRDRRGKLPVRSLLKLKLAGISIHEGSSFYEETKKKIIIDEFLKPSWFIFEEGFSQTPLHRSLKRAQGIFVSSILLTVLFPVFLFIALLIKMESSGPVFYLQERVGLNGRIFKLIKYRSMDTAAEALSGPTFTQDKDPRVTRIGKVIRKFRIDEMPQFINILKGDMDLVGPRPERPVFVEHLEEVVPYYNLRHSVRPGLTGWAQVNYPYGDSLEDSKEKLQYDLYYVKHSSWFFDLYIMMLTIKEILTAKGR